MVRYDFDIEKTKKGADVRPYIKARNTHLKNIIL